MLILEGIVTTTNDDETINVSPMGPIVDREITQLCLRPFRTSTTYRNLRRRGEGVFHITDDVELLARSAVGALLSPPEMFDAPAIQGKILRNACRWFAFRVTQWEDRQPRTTIRCAVVDQGRLRDFFGFNRAKHAVVEAAILATRVHLLPPEDIADQFAHLAVVVEKTAGDQEQRAFEFLRSYVQNEIGSVDDRTIVQRDRR